MTTYDNAAPMDGWQVEPRCCPFGDRCATCGPAPLTIPPNVILGSE